MTCKRCAQAQRQGDVETLHLEMIRHRRAAFIWLCVALVGSLITLITAFV